MCLLFHAWAPLQGGTGGTRPTQYFYFLTLRLTMGVAWKESTPESLRHPQYSEGGGAPGFMIFFYFEVVP